MILIHYRAAEAALPEMATAFAPGVDDAGIAPMDRCQCTPQAVRIGGHQNQVNMVGHQHPGPAGDACGLQAFSQEIAIERVIGIDEEGALAAIATLGDMVRQVGDDDTGKAGHGLRGYTGGCIRSIKCTVTEIPEIKSAIKCTVTEINKVTLAGAPQLIKCTVTETSS